MPTTDVKIINRALSHLGASVFMDDRAEDSTAAEVADVHYDEAIAYVQEKYDWGFTKREIALGLITDFRQVSTLHDWEFAYRYPVDVCRVRRLLNGVGRQDPAPPKYEIGSDDIARLILTNQEEAVAEVSLLITDASLYSAMFAEAVSWWLAFLFTPTLAKDKSITADLLTVTEKLMGAAAAHDGNEAQWNPQPYESEAIRSRD